MEATNFSTGKTVAPMQTIEEARAALQNAWVLIKSECLLVLGSELHYQAMIYHALRTAGRVPLSQIGMNVKMWINNPVSELFKKLDSVKHPDYQGGFEPIPDVVIFKPEINADWRRRNRENTLINMLIAIEVKASERAKSKLRLAEIELDIRKLAAHREEVLHLGSSMLPVMLIIDSAPNESERMNPTTIEQAHNLAKKLDVAFMYTSPTFEVCNI